MPPQVDLTINTKAKTADLIKATEQAQEFINTIKLGVGIDLGEKLVESISEVGVQFKDALVEGVKFNSTVQDARLAIAAMLKSAEPQKFKSFDSALAESGKGIAALQKAAVETPFSFETLLESLQGISAPLAEGGVKDLQKQVQLVTLLSQAAKTLNIPQQQFQADARDLVSGRIGRTLLGRSLGITDDEINQAKKQGTLYDFLTQKLSAYGEAGTRSLDNLSTRASNLYDKLQQVEGVSTQGIFDQISALAKDLSDAISTPEFENTAQSVGSELSVITGAIAGLVRVVADHPAIFAALAQGAVVFGASLTLLNLPRVVTGLVQIATTAVPALANLAALTQASKDEGRALDDTTAKLNANTDALNTNASAAPKAQGQYRDPETGQYAVAPAPDAGASDSSTQQSTDETIANTAATEANNAAIAASAKATEESNSAAAGSNAVTAESTTLTEANTLSTEANTTAINASNGAAVANNQETLASNELTQESTAVTNENTASTVTNTEAIDASNAGAVANNAETRTSNELTRESTSVTDDNTASTVRSNAAAEQSLAIGAQEEGIAAKENELTAAGIALDDQSTAAVLRSNAAGDQAIAIGKQETTIVAKENLLTDESTAKTILNTAAVKQSNQTNQEALAIGQEQVALEESETAATGEHAAEVAADTAAIEQNTAAKEANASASAADAAAPVAAGAGTSAASTLLGGKVLSAGNISAALTSVLSIGQVYVAYEGYVDQVNQANKGLSQDLDTQLGTLKQQVSTVSTQADQAKLIGTLKDQEQKAEDAINTARSHGLETNQETVRILQDYQKSIQDSLVKAQGLTASQLDTRAAAQQTADALSKEADALAKISEGFDKANIKYRAFLANQQVTEGKTHADRLNGTDKEVQVQLDRINEPLSGPDKFKSADDVENFLKPENADPARQALKKAQDDATLTVASSLSKVKDATEALARAQSTLDAANARSRGNALQQRAGAAAAVAEAQTRLQSAKDDLDSARSAQDTANKNTQVFEGKYNLAASGVEALKETTKQKKSQIKDDADSEQKLEDAANRQAIAATEKNYKDRLISLEEYLRERRAEIKASYDAEVGAINRTPGQDDEDKNRALKIAKINFEGANTQLDLDVADKRRQETVRATQEQARQLSLQAEEARAGGNVDLAEDLDNQVAILQKKASLQSDNNLSVAQEADLIAKNTSAMRQQYQLAQNEKDAEQSLETREKQAADALSKLQAQQQLINSSNALPDAKNDALRENVLEQNQVLQQQLQLLEQRRLLALADPTKSPNDRALTAAQIQQQEDQTQAQIVGNQIAADKLTFTGQFTNDLATFAQSFGSTAQQSAGVVTGTLGTAVGSISKNLTGIIEGTVGVKEGFLNMARDVIDQLIELTIKLAITLALQEALDVADVASAPAAGAAAGTLAAGLATAGSVGGFAEGGLVPGAPSNSDNRIATIATGEYVARAAAVSHYGAGLFHALNNMAIPRHAVASIDMPVRARSSIGFASGGLVAPLPPLVARTPTTPAEFNAHTHIGVLNTRQQMIDFMRKGDGKKIMLDVFDGRLRDLGYAS